MVMKMAMISIASTRPPAVDGISSWSNVLSRTMCPSHETHANCNDGAGADWDDDHDGVGDDDDSDGVGDDDDDCMPCAGIFSRRQVKTTMVGQ